MLAIRVCAADSNEVSQYENFFSTQIKGNRVPVTDDALAGLCDTEVLRNNYKLGKDWDMTDRKRVLGAIVGALSLRGI